ncbi:Stk1 family PASTA domain-containing Ser/Thr kinase [Parafrankia discariae]|uniref:Stk1 family PASTA domain-containing Ser/Thr kinase n=1 Tax=Parafrankia discariae TaxID=365528 RepID=UPI000366AC45|nr:Stk1 family PASTA domain-containing Ser/Thr kinase [Parafrankia discariae]
MTDVTDRYDAQPRLVGERYELGGCIGYGGMAEVYRGRDIRLGREVAVKTLRADLARDPTFLARFRREAQSSASLNHPAIVSVYDTGEDVINGTQLPYIVMEFIEGQTLRDVLQAQGPLDERHAMQVTAEICAALDYSHRMGIIHRDIKPANVMLATDGSAKVMDFGIARATTATTSNMTATSAVIGTAQYLSPEQARGARVDTRSDVYSTGVLLYELLTGEPPFRGDNPVAVAYQHVREIPPPPSSHDARISPEADAVVLKAMEKDPDDRYATAGEMREDLERALSGHRVHAMMMGAGDETMLGDTGAGTAGTALLGNSRGGYDDRYEGRTGYQGRYDDGYDEPGGYDDGYGEQTRLGGQSYDRFDQTGPVDRYGNAGPPGHRAGAGADEDRAGSSTWKFVLAGLGAVVVFVVVALLASSLLGGGGDGGDTAAAEITIPSGLKGQPYDAVVARLQSSGFTGHFDKQTQESTEVKPDAVLEISPGEGQTIAADGTISITVASAPGQQVVPNDIVGMSQQAATDALTGLGLQVSAMPYYEAASQGVGKVEKADPEAGSPVDAGGTVTIWVVSSTVNVPNVTGKAAAAAISELQRYGLTPVQETGVNNSQQPGTVFDQSPSGGAVNRGSKVKIFIAAENQQPTTPPATATTPPPTEDPPVIIEPTTPPATTPPAVPTTPAGGGPPTGGQQPGAAGGGGGAGR